MKLFRNFILIALCLSLFVAVLASCGDDDASSNTLEETSALETDTQTEEQTTEKSVYTGNPIVGGTQTQAPPAGGGEQTSETQGGGSSTTEALTNGFSGGGMELPGITP